MQDTVRKGEEMKFPNELFVIVESQGSDCECYISALTVDEHAVIGEKRTVARYRLVEELVVESKIVTTAKRPRGAKK
jgi:hypothetical protein